MTIAIVDDDLEDRDIFRALIAKVRPEATCLEFQNPQELAVYLSNHDELPHFLFVDMNMPRINGLECILQLRNIERYQHMKIAVYSTHISPQQRNRFGELNVRIIIKSTNLSKLTESIETSLAELNEK